MVQFDQDKSKKVQKPEEMIQYVTGAGGCIVSKSILNKKTGLKWIFRQEDGIGNGWIAFGETDTQAYLDDAENLAIVDFNTLANIEPTVLNILYMPVGADLEFKSDKSGKYFVDTKTGKEIREAVKHPAQIAFEKNLKFLNQENYPIEFFQALFEKNDLLEPFVIGEMDFPSGEIVLADPLAYLGDEKYSTYLNQTIPAGVYPIELSICHSPIAGLRIAAAKLKVSSRVISRYELAMPKGKTIEQVNEPGVFSFFGVDAGVACICDAIAAGEYAHFFKNWFQDNPGKNKYDDYFSEQFRSSYEKFPDVQREGGDFMIWTVPETNHRIPMFASGLGDGVYSAYWGIDSEGQVAELIIPFMNPQYFDDEN